jgi:hypothetical protein
MFLTSWRNFQAVWNIKGCELIFNIIDFFLWRRAPQQMLRTHRSREAYCATLWCRWWLCVFFSFFPCNVAPVEWNWQGKTEVLGGGGKNCPSVTLSTTNCTWTDPGFFSCPVFPFLIHFVLLNPSVLLHVTYVPYYCPYTTNTTQTSMPPAGFEPTIPESERPQTHPLDRAVTGIGRDRTWASAVTGRRLTVWAMAQA